MRIRNIKIKNFRGIKNLDWSIHDANIICLIGKGDSSKSTILDAIKYTFSPQWNLSLVDSDFYKCKTDECIEIPITIGNLSDDFCSIEKYGLHLRGWSADQQKIFDEPDDILENVLTIQLKIDKDLEPKWSVINDRHPEGVEFKTAHRNKVGVSVIGAYSERQLSWGNGTALTKLTDSKNIDELLANATRTARSSLGENRENLKNFDDAARKAENVAKALGVPVKNLYQAHLDLNSINIKIGGLTLHDGDMPLRLLGLGSRRMLLCGIQKDQLEYGHITLFDEIEFGLEPHRITRLIKHIKEDIKGQYFITTHSPSVLRELTINDLHILHNKDGEANIVSIFNKGLEQDKIQGKVRSSAEAFLAKKIVICEGATEVGFLRGFDDYQVSKNKNPLSYYGVALLNAGGASKIKELAKTFNSLKYSVSILADGDAPKQFSESDGKELSDIGIEVKIWSDGLSLEQRAMTDLPWQYVKYSMQLARDTSGYPVKDNVQSTFGSALNDNIEQWGDTPKLRVAIGKAALNSSWFKDTTRGDLWFDKISPAFDDDHFRKTDLYVKLNELWAWIENE